MAASVGTRRGRKGNDASRPRTMKTVSPTPAPTESTPTRLAPDGLPSGASGCSTSSFRPAGRDPCVWRRPCPRPSPTARASELRQLDRVDDTDHGGVHRHLLQLASQPRRAAADDQHGFAEPRINRVDRHQLAAARRAAASSGWATSSLLPTSRSSFCVATTVPMILARIMYKLGLRPKPPTSASGDPCAPRRPGRAAPCAACCSLATSCQPGGGPV